MGAILSLIGLLGAEFLKKVGWDTVKWVAQRAFLIGLCLGIGPIVLYKGFSMITRYMMEYGMGKVSAEGIQPVMVQFVGVGGWFAYQLKVPEAFSVFLSFCMLSLMLRMVRVK